MLVLIFYLVVYYSGIGKRGFFNFLQNNLINKGTSFHILDFQYISEEVSTAVMQKHMISLSISVNGFIIFQRKFILYGFRVFFKNIFYMSILHRSFLFRLRMRLLKHLVDIDVSILPLNIIIHTDFLILVSLFTELASTDHPKARLLQSIQDLMKEEWRFISCFSHRKCCMIRKIHISLLILLMVICICLCQQNFSSVQISRYSAKFFLFQFFYAKANTIFFLLFCFQQDRIISVQIFWH